LSITFSIGFNVPRHPRPGDADIASTGPLQEPS
jgi:hypothetical protein